MQLSTEDMKRLMTGGASIYQSLHGQPSSVEYWMQAYLGACTFVDGRSSKIPEVSWDKDLNRPAPFPLQKAFDTLIKDPEAWDFRELALLCKAYKVEWPARHLTYSVYHPRQRQNLPDSLLIQAQHILTSLGKRHPSARPFDPQLTKKDFLNLTPIDRKLCCRFRWLTQQDSSWVEWLTESTAKEQFEVLMENIYRQNGPFEKIWHNWGRTKSKKLRAMLLVIAWKNPEFRDTVDLPNWYLNSYEGVQKAAEKEIFAWPTPPLLSKLLLTREEKLQAWLPSTWQNLKENPDLPELQLHAAHLYGDKKQIQKYWPQIEFDENAIDLYRSAAKQLEPKFFLNQYTAISKTTTFPPDQIDQVQKWLYASDIFIPAEQSVGIWGLLEKWSDMPEAQETLSFLQLMGQRLSNRLHPSTVSETSSDPFDFFDSARLTEWEDQMKKRRSLYQTLAKWQKNN